MTDTLSRRSFLGAGAAADVRAKAQHLVAQAVSLAEHQHMHVVQRLRRDVLALCQRVRRRQPVRPSRRYPVQWRMLLLPRVRAGVVTAAVAWKKFMCRILVTSKT